VPMLVVYNKADLREDDQQFPRKGMDGSVFISARDDASIELLKDVIIETAYGDYEEAEFIIPYDRGNVAAALSEKSHVFDRDYRDNGTYIRAKCHRGDIEKYREFLIGEL